MVSHHVISQSVKSWHGQHEVMRLDHGDISPEDVISRRFRAPMPVNSQRNHIEFT